jgi:hypothetical protein
MNRASLLLPLWRPLAVAALSLGALSAAAGQANVGVTVQVQQPGFYGRVQIGNAPPPVIYAQPVLIEQRRVAVVQRPIYLRVPPGHERRWARYCGRYQACGQPVYFVRPEHRMREFDRHERQERHERDDRRGHGEGDWGRERGGDGGGERGHGHGHHGH